MTVAILGIGSVALPAAASDIVGQRAENSPAPVGLTAELDGVPTLAPISLPVPYQLEWQRRLLAFQQAFEARLSSRGLVPVIDPIETGAISGAR